MTSFDHAFWTYVFTRNKKPYVKWYVIGAVMPDLVYFFAFAYLGIKEAMLNLSLIFGVVKLVISGYSPHALSDPLFNQINLLFGKVFNDPHVLNARMITHSLFLWSIAYMACVMIKGRNLNALKAFLLGWCGHLIVDVLTHATDAVPFLFPVSSWIVKSPISYWNPDYYGREFYLVNLFLTGLSITYLLYKRVEVRWQKKVVELSSIINNGYRYRLERRKNRH